MVTADLDYPRLLALTRSRRPGLILFRRGNYTDQQVIERLVKALEATTEDDLYGSLITIERWRIRKRPSSHRRPVIGSANVGRQALSLKPLVPPISGDRGEGEPRWTPRDRPSIDGSTPAITVAAAELLARVRHLVQEQRAWRSRS